MRWNILVYSNRVNELHFSLRFNQVIVCITTSNCCDVRRCPITFEQAGIQSAYRLQKGKHDVGELAPRLGFRKRDHVQARDHVHSACALAVVLEQRRFRSLSAADSCVANPNGSREPSVYNMAPSPVML